MPLINKHGEKILAKRDRVFVEPGGGYFRVFYKTTKIVGAVEKVSIILDDSQKVTQAVHKMYSN